MIDYNGSLLEEDSPVLSAKDNGFFYGMTLYETLYVKSNKVAFFKDHFNRFQSCLSYFGVELPTNFYGNLRQRVNRLIEKENCMDARLRVTFSTGLSSLLEPNPDKFTTVISLQKLESRKDTIDLYISSYKKPYPSVMPPYIKYTANFPSHLSFIEAKKNGYDEGLLLTWNDIITEGSYCNLFWEDSKGTIKTPSLKCSILDGVTRSQLLLAASKCGLKVEEGEYNQSELFDCKSLFISSSTRGLMPVLRLNQRIFMPNQNPMISKWIEQYNILLEQSFIGVE